MTYCVANTLWTVFTFSASRYYEWLLKTGRSVCFFPSVAGCQVLDPQIAAWLLDPADSASCFQDLLNKYCTRPTTHTPALAELGHKKVRTHTNVTVARRTLQPVQQEHTHTVYKRTQRHFSILCTEILDELGLRIQVKTILSWHLIKWIKKHKTSEGHVERYGSETCSTR